MPRAWRTKSLAWSSDDTWSDNTARTKSDHNNKRHDRPPSRSLPSSSGSSIETTRVDRRTQRERRNAMRRYPSSDEQHLFTHFEDRSIGESLRQKLLSNNGARLGNIERCLLRAANRLDGRASVTAFEDALAADAKAIAAAGRGERIRWNEALWLTKKLRGRNRRHVAVSRIRAVLEAGHRGGRRDDDGENTQQHLKRYQRRDPFRARSHDGEGGGGAHGGGLAGSGRVGRTMSGSTNESGVCRVEAVRRRSAYPARWAIRQGTVGQWLHDVASPMVSLLLFPLKLPRRYALL